MVNSPQGQVAMEEELLVSAFEPAQFWNEAFPLGSGRLGAMVFGGVKSELVQLNGTLPLSLFTQSNFSLNKKSSHSSEICEDLKSGSCSSNDPHEECM